MTRLESYGRLPAEIDVLDPELWEAPLRLGWSDGRDPVDSLRRTPAPDNGPYPEDDR